jgi:branched-chain amino acid transport system permease protein
MGYLRHLLVYADIYVILAVSLNLVVGYAGLLTLAHASHFAVGAYAYALLTVVFGLSFPVALVGSVMTGAISSLMLSVPAWRLRGDFFVLASLAVQALTFSVLNNWADPATPFGSWGNLTNGPIGIPGIPLPSLDGERSVTMPQFVMLSTALAAFCALVTWRLARSPWGRLVRSMRDDELAARGLGKNTRLLKVQVFGVAAALAAVAGALYASYVGYLDPTSASLDHGILMLSMVVVGGLGNLRGPIVGAVCLIALPELLRAAQFPDVQAANLRLAIYGLLLVLVMHFRPQGISGEYRPG